MPPLPPPPLRYDDADDGYAAAISPPYALRYAAAPLR